MALQSQATHSIDKSITPDPTAAAEREVIRVQIELADFYDAA